MLALVFAVLATVMGLRTNPHLEDVDEAVYSHTLVAMQHGMGYYPAMREALVSKEGAPPSEIRAVRPPTMFVVVSAIPRPLWRWAVGLVFLASLLLAWRLGRSVEQFGGPIAVAVMGLWLMSASAFLYLHAELWGLPLLLGGVLALRNERWAAAAVLLASAAAVRELYAVAFVVGFVVTQDRKWWWPVGALGAGFAVVHAGLASAILSPTGTQTPFGTDHLTWQYVCNALSPFDHPLGWFVGLAGGALGAAGLVRRWGYDRGARTLLLHAAVMVPLAVFVGRNYWALTMGPAVACFAAEGVVAMANAPWRIGLARPRPSRAVSS
ncbi:MAG TPA: hypothetical protein VHC63_10120 [Acidimicrobiales bacterium]|nr:hypothetical protein [Acidimicrobiales bacterium]